MIFQQLEKYFAKKKYKNIIEAIYWNTLFRKLTGLTVIEIRSVGGTLEINFSTVGFLSFLWYATLFSYCACVSYTEDQSIVRMMFDTKLKQYGDLFEKLSTVIFVFYVMIKVAFLLSNDLTFAHLNCEVDKCITDMRVVGVSVNYVKHTISSIKMVIAQEIMWLFRVFSIFGILHGLDTSIPLEKIFQGAFSDALALGLATAYCYYLFIWKERYGNLNDVLINIKQHKLWEQTFFVRVKGSDSGKATQLQDKFICEKIRMCACLNTKLYDGIQHINRKFGIALAVTIFMCINYGILYMFYFMEATAAGLFHDIERYLRLLVFIFWQIGYCAFIFFVIVYYTEDALQESKKTSLILHEIIQNDFSPAVNTEAMQFSVQLMHQVPVLKAHGLYEINYAILYEASKFIMQFLVILLQFVDSK
ncbi:putative gustatory receptor 28b [Plodia interpunctella]|uniref:putative gustatory receptor 28b n=1 Tax=Plodia interpunctella TaxID=58824 RepID=UPI002367DB2A|nr:putative gustatory receptor 28b [Plodia interpunctella]